MLELFHLLIKKRGKNGLNVANKLLEAEYDVFDILYGVQNNDDLLNVLSILSEHGSTTTIGSRDSAIIHTIRAKQIDILLSHDKGFNQVTDIEIIDPTETRR